MNDVAFEIFCACLIGLIGALILNAWEAMVYRGNLRKLKAYIESLRCESIMSYDQQLDAVLAYIMAILGER